MLQEGRGRMPSCSPELHSPGQAQGLAWPLQHTHHGQNPPFPPQQAEGTPQPWGPHRRAGHREGGLRDAPSEALQYTQHPHPGPLGRGQLGHHNPGWQELNPPPQSPPRLASRSPSCVRLPAGDFREQDIRPGPGHRDTACVPHCLIPDNVLTGQPGPHSSIFRLFSILDEAPSSRGLAASFATSPTCSRARRQSCSSQTKSLQDATH